MTGPALRPLNACAACSPVAMNAYMANKMTSASMVTRGPWQRDDPGDHGQDAARDQGRAE
jgi:hypothetical protein